MTTDESEIGYAAPRKGAVTYIDAAKVAQAARLVRKGHVIPLNARMDRFVGGTPDRIPLRRGIRSHNRLRPITMGPYAGKGFAVVNDDYVEFALQGSTQLDALGHFGAILQGEDHLYYGGAGFDEVNPEPLSKTLGIEVYGGAIVTRGILIDLLAVVAPEAKYLPHEARPGAEVIDECLKRQNITIERGDAVLLYTGYPKRIAELDATGMLEEGRRSQTEFIPSPGVDGSTTKIWRERHISLLACDNRGIDPVPVTSFEIHIESLRNDGIALGELWHLERLREACQDDGVWEFLLVSVPLNLPGMFGSPANAVALR